MGIVIPFPVRREKRAHVIRRRKPIGVLDVLPRGEASVEFECRAITRVERLLFAGEAQTELLLVDAMTVDGDDMLLGTIPLSLLRGSHLELPTMNEGAEFRLAVRSIARERIVVALRAEIVQVVNR